MIQLYHGDGKGKTTAAIGAVVRAAGNDRRVIFAQFMKGSPSGELCVLRDIPHVRVMRSPKDFGFYDRMSEAEKKELTGIHNEMVAEIEDLIVSGETDFVVLDEITHALRYKLVDKHCLFRLLRDAKTDAAVCLTREMAGDRNKKNCEIILTGQKPSEELLEISDYISEIRCIRHPHQAGVAARPGIEY